MYKGASKTVDGKTNDLGYGVFPWIVYGKTPNTRLGPHPERMISVKRKWTKDRVQNPVFFFFFFLSPLAQ